MSTTTTAVEIDGLKTRLKETWMAGNYDRFSRYMSRRTIVPREVDRRQITGYPSVGGPWGTTSTSELPTMRPESLSAALTIRLPTLID